MRRKNVVCTSDSRINVLSTIFHLLYHYLLLRLCFQLRQYLHLNLHSRTIANHTNTIQCHQHQRNTHIDKCNTIIRQNYSRHDTNAQCISVVCYTTNQSILHPVHDTKRHYQAIHTTLYDTIRHYTTLFDTTPSHTLPWNSMCW